MRLRFFLPIMLSITLSACSLFESPPPLQGEIIFISDKYALWHKQTAIMPRLDGVTFEPLKIELTAKKRYMGIGLDSVNKHKSAYLHAIRSTLSGSQLLSNKTIPDSILIQTTICDQLSRPELKEYAALLGLGNDNRLKIRYVSELKNANTNEVLAIVGSLNDSEKYEANLNAPRNIDAIEKDFLLLSDAIKQSLVIIKR